MQRRRTITAAAIAGLAVIAACAQGTGGSRRDTADTSLLVSRAASRCDAAAFGYLIGSPQSALKQARLPKSTRVVCHGCQVTQDYSPNRLNVILGEDGKVASVTCG